MVGLVKVHKEQAEKKQSKITSTWARPNVLCPVLTEIKLTSTERGKKEEQRFTHADRWNVEKNLIWKLTPCWSPFLWHRTHYV